MSRNRVGSLTDKRGVRVARVDEGQRENEKRPRKAEPQSPFGAGNEIRLRVYECSALHEYGSSTQAKPSTLTTSTLATLPGPEHHSGNSTTSTT